MDTATLTINDASASEGEGLTFTVTLSEAVQGGLTVTPSYTHGTASKDDYSTNTTGISFTGTKGETKTFTVSSTEDAVLEANETFTVGLTVSGTTLTDRITATDTGTGTINNDDSASVTIADANASEGSGISFTVTLSAAVQGGLKVTPGYTNGTAAGTDYTANTGALTFTGTANETQSFTVSTKDDAVLEANETFTVGLTVSGTSLSITATDTATGTINNDDSASVTIADANADEGDGISFTVTLDNAVQGGLTVTPGYTNGTAAGTDYTANTGALTFTGTANETKSFTVSTTEDAVLEEAETFTVGLTVSGTTLSITATDTATGTINNDDGATVTVNNANADEGESMTFTVSLGDAVQGGLTVTPSFTDVTAVEGTDYDENTTALTFTGTANETQSFTVSTTEDAVLEGNETFTVGLTVSGTTLSITATDTGTGTINNDDGATVTIDDASASEGDSLTFTVTLGEAVQGGLKVTPSFTDGTAVEGTDYDENTTALTFTGTKGETKSFTVSTTEDAVFEANETFTVDLTVSGTTLSITASDTGTGTINNDESAEVTVNDANADEGENITFTVTLDTAVQGGLTVTPSYTNGTAAGSDYTENTAALNFSGTKGETKSFTVSTTEEAVVEYGETFTVSLSVSNAPSGITATDTGAGTINNDDSATVSVNDASASESGSLTFTVTLSEAVQGGLTVTPGYTDGTATAGEDYTPNTASLSFTGTRREKQTFTVATIGDTVLEADESFTVNLSVSNAPPGVAPAGSASAARAEGMMMFASAARADGMALASAGVSGTGGLGMITNDDEAEVTINDASAVEGGNLTFTVTLDTAVQGGLTVTPSYSNGTAARSVDFTENTTPISFSGTKGETQTFTVATIKDFTSEEDEWFLVALSASNAPSGMISSDTGRGTIQDRTVSVVDLSVSPPSVSEGAGATAVTVTAAFADGKSLTGDEAIAVTVGSSNDSAAAGADYEVVAGFTLTIAAGETSGTGTFTLTPTQDTEVEEDESIGVFGSSTDLTVNGTSVTITDDDGTPAVYEVDLSVSPASVNEGDEATSVTVTAAFAEANPFTEDKVITVTVGASGDSAEAGSDYAAVSDFTLTIEANQTSGSATFTLTPIDDTEVEGDEAIGVSGSAKGLTVNGTSLRLTDDDTAMPAVNLSVSPSSVNEGDEATSVTVTAAFTEANPFTEATTITVSVGDSGTAVSGTDYAAVADFVSITIAGGETSGTGSFTLTPTPDTEVEEDETIGVTGSATGVTVKGTELTLTERNAAPVAVDDRITVERGQTVSALTRGGNTADGEGTRSGEPLQDSSAIYSVLANDSDLEDEGEELRAELVRGPQHGELVLRADGTFTYTHDGSRSSEDRFIYRAYDSQDAYSNEATAHIEVFSTNAGPIAVGTIPDQTLLLGKDGRVEVEEYFSDPDDDRLEYAVASLDEAIVTASVSGIEVGLTPVSVAVTRVTVTASDPEGLSAEQSFAVTVISVGEDEGKMVDLSLAVLGRTVASQAVEAISGRLDQGSPGSQATLGGHQFDLGSGEGGSVQVAGWVQGLARMLGRGQRYVVPAQGGDPKTAAGRPAPGQTGANTWWAEARPGVSLEGNLPLFSGGSFGGSSFGSGSFGSGSPGLSQDPMRAGRDRSGFAGQDMMSTSSFQFSPDRKGSPEKGSQKPGPDQRWTVWGQGVGSQFSGRSDGEYSLDGRVGAAYLGADHRWGSKGVLGVAASRSQGTLDYENIGGGPGGLDATLTSVHPYAQWSPRPGVNVWGLMGFGRGTADLRLSGDRMETGLGIWMGAVGGRSELARLGAVEVALKADAFAVSVDSEAVEYVREGRGEAQRMRLMVDAGTRWAVSPNVQMAPNLEMGIRMDGGDAETGLGAELAGGMKVANQRLGLEVEARGHWLAAHQDRNFRERGLSLSVSLDPGADGEGWRFLMRPLWGRQSSGPESMWQNEQMLTAYSGQEELSWSPNRAQAGLSYEKKTWGGRGRVGPFAQMEMDQQGSPRLGGGLRLQVVGSPAELLEESQSKGLFLELFGDHQRVRQGSASGLLPAERGNPDRRVGVSLTLTFWRWDAEWTAEMPRPFWGQQE